MVKTNFVFCDLLLQRPTFVVFCLLTLSFVFCLCLLSFDFCYKSPFAETFAKINLSLPTFVVFLSFVFSLFSFVFCLLTSVISYCRDLHQEKSVLANFRGARTVDCSQYHGASLCSYFK